MFLSQLAADMILHLSDGAAKDCADRMADDYERDGAYERTRLTYLLLSSLVMDYIEVSRLKKGALHERLVTSWGKLVRVFAGLALSYSELCQYCDRGLIPIQLKHMLIVVPKDYDRNGILELPKARLDNMITIVEFVKDSLLGATVGDDAGKWFMEAGRLLLAVGEAMPSGTKLRDSSFIFPHSGSRLDKATPSDWNEKDRLFNLD